MACCSPSPEFLQLTSMIAAALLTGRDLETLDADLVARRAVDVATALAREIQSAIEGEPHE